MTIASARAYGVSLDPASEIGSCLGVAAECDRMAAHYMRCTGVRVRTRESAAGEAHEQSARMRIEAVEWLLLWVRT